MRVNWKDRDYIVSVCEAAESKRDILEKLGLPGKGSSFYTLKKWADRYGIELPDGNLNERRGYKTRIPLEELLVENSNYSSHRLKNRLFKSGLLQERCYTEGCNVGSEWMGKKISLHLDHINGNHDDNRIENLRILCPNCHSQTDTWGTKIRN